MFKNYHINRMLEVQLNKKSTDINSNDLINIKNMFFSKASNDGIQDYCIDELEVFPNLTNLTIASSLINKEDIDKLKSLDKLESINFSKCIIAEDLDFSSMKSLKNLELDRCYISSFLFIKTIKECTDLAIIYPYNEDDEKLDINYINCNLKKLSLEGCDICNEYNLSNLSNLKTINLLSTDVSDFSFVSELESLEKIYVSPKYSKDVNLIDKEFQVAFSIADIVMDDMEGKRQLI